MRLLASLLIAVAASAADTSSWSEILASVGASPATLGIEILEGESPRATLLGFRATGKRVTVRSVEDLRNSKLKIVWEKSIDLPVFELPADAQLFTRERWQHAPLVAGLRRDGRAILWLATSPGTPGYARFPYLLQALADLGLEPPFRSARLWAFFDSSYRLRADPDYLAAHWRAAGIQAIHAAAWHYWEPDPQGDKYLRELMDACHRHAIQVYAWLELPHVSERFWESHPEWREKTALPGRASRLAEADQSGESASRRGGRRRTPRVADPLRLGWRESGRAVFRIARRVGQPGAIHAHERRCAGGIQTRRRG